jgi:hypothetical protein
MILLKQVAVAMVAATVAMVAMVAAIAATAATVEMQPRVYSEWLVSPPAPVPMCKKLRGLTDHLLVRQKSKNRISRTTAAAAAAATVAAAVL